MGNGTVCAEANFFTNCSSKLDCRNSYEKAEYARNHIESAESCAVWCFRHGDVYCADWSDSHCACRYWNPQEGGVPSHRACGRWNWPGPPAPVPTPTPVPAPMPVQATPRPTPQPTVEPTQTPTPRPSTTTSTTSQSSRTITTTSTITPI